MLTQWPSNTVLYEVPVRARVNTTKVPSVFSRDGLYLRQRERGDMSLLFSDSSWKSPNIYMYIMYTLQIFPPPPPPPIIVSWIVVREPVLWNQNRNFFLSGTGTTTHSGSGTGFELRSNIKWNTKVKIVKKIWSERPTFLDTLLPLVVKRKKFVKICIWVYIWFQIWIRNRNRNFSKVGTGPRNK